MLQTPLRRATALGALFVGAVATPAWPQATAIVRQGGTEVTLTALQGTLDARTFYSYGVPLASCANTGLETFSTSLLFLYEDTSAFPPSLALVVLNDRPGNRTGGDATYMLSGLPLASTYLQLDDPFDTFTPDPPVGGQTTAQLSWGTCCTDGFVLGGLETEPYCIAVQPGFVTGVFAWNLLDGPDRFSPTHIPLPSLTETTYLCSGACVTLECRPSITAECAGNGTAFVQVIANAASLCGGAAVVNDVTAGGADASADYSLGSTDVTFALRDAAGFTASCTTRVTVEDTLPPLVTNCPAPLSIACAGPGGIPVTDPRIQAWLASFTASDACGVAQLSNDAPALFPSGCPGTATPVRFTATDDLGHSATCDSSVRVTIECLQPPANVGAGLRVTDHGDPLAPQIRARLDWLLDEGQPRPAGEHYHVLRSTDPVSLTLLFAIEPWPNTELDEATPAAVSLPLVHFYSVLSANRCEDQSED